MIRFSANLGFLWTDRTLPDAIRSAKRAGFHAVECHWPFDIPPEEINSALRETGLPMLGLNTRRGDVRAGENGLCAVPGREKDALTAIEEAVDYADAIGAGAIHVMAGFAEGKAAHETFVGNLALAVRLARDKEITILIEPLNRFDMPGYFLKDTAQARAIIAEVAAPNLKLMFDCYHVGRTEGDVIERLRDLLPVIGHIQFASVPDRGTPDHGDVDYAGVFSEIEALGWTRPLGAEYRPKTATDASLQWFERFK